MKTSHRFQFHFDHKPILEEYEALKIDYEKHFNTGFYEGEWSGFALRKPETARYDLFAGNNSSDTYINTALWSRLKETQKVLDFFPCEKTSVRILKLTPGSSIKPHTDEGLNFFDGFVRFHIPIQTNPHIEFIVAGESINMKEGECWFADFNQIHSVKNEGISDRLHLVFDVKVNNWIEELFLKERIIEPNEEAPDPIDEYQLDEKKQIALELIKQNSETSLKLAKELMDKYSFKV